MTPGFETLQQLATLAANGPATRLGLTRIADVLRMRWALIRSALSTPKTLTG